MQNFTTKHIKLIETWIYAGSQADRHHTYGGNVFTFQTNSYRTDI